MIVVLWLVVGGIIKVAGSMKPSPDKIRKFAENNNLSSIEDPERRKLVIGKVAEMMNKMEAGDLQSVEGNDADRELARQFRESMTPDEFYFFMEKRMGRAFSQMMEVFNDMERDERKTMVADALKRIRRQQEKGERSSNNQDMEEADPEFVEKVAEAGLEAYFRDASAETKMDLAPLMEEVQKMMNGTGFPRGPRRRRDK